VETIKTISGLIIKLKENSNSAFGAILNKLELHNDYIKESSSWSFETYTRNCLYKDEDFELILLCWEQGQKTPVHCHGGEECWVKLISGELNEMLYEKDKIQFDKAVKTQKINVNGQSYMNDLIGMHSLENTFKGRTISLHLYAKPIKRCQYYNQEKNLFISKNLSYDVDLSASS
jgi:cysteine dioxygenase